MQEAGVVRQEAGGRRQIMYCRGHPAIEPPRTPNCCNGFRERERGFHEREDAPRMHHRGCTDDGTSPPRFLVAQATTVTYVPNSVSTVYTSSPSGI